MSRTMDAVAAEVRRCAYAWESGARVVGNVTAGELRALMSEREQSEGKRAKLQAKANEVPGLSAALDEARGPVRFVADAMVSAMKREFQSASDKARVSNDPTREGYAMAMRDALKVVQAVAERETREVSHD